MKLKVSPHKIKIEEEEITNEKEIKISDITFDFDEEITDDYVKEAYFTNEDGNTYKVLIQNDKCNYPQEVLETIGNIEIGVVAYLVENEEEIKRYNPTPISKFIEYGSLKDAENSEPITPTDKEQMEQALNNGLNDIAEAVENAERLDIDVNKEETTTTITITKQDGTTKSVEVLDGTDGQDGQDGVSLEYSWSGTNLGIKREDEENYEYVNLKGERGEPGAIQMIIVNELPQTGQEDTIYLVPLVTPESQENRYAEYIYINDKWELLGKIGIQVDLTDYYTKTETNNLLDNKADVSDIPDLTNYVQNTDYPTYSSTGVIKKGNGLNVNNTTGVPYVDAQDYTTYQSSSNNTFISKGTLENVITGKDLTTKSYVDGLVGDINTALDSINGEVI